MLSIISCRFPNGPLPKRLPPKLNTHHTHNFKCFSPFHFPFFFINSFNFLAFANQLNIPTSTHALEVYHNEQDKEIEKVKKKREKIVVSGIELKKGIMKWNYIIYLYGWSHTISILDPWCNHLRESDLWRRTCMFASLVPRTTTRQIDYMIQAWYLYGGSNCLINYIGYNIRD